MLEDQESSESIHNLYEKIEKSKLNSFITLAKDEAIKRAELADKGRLPGKLSGVPVAIKDNISTKGIRTTCASHILENYIPPYDAHVVELLKREGAVILGKTNMDEFAMGSSTETSHFGPTRNPWDHERVPGGSSGGSAAAVASGEAPLSLGSDTGGSVRCPASFCGVVGLKPTYGLVSRYGLIAYANSLEQIGPIAPDVRGIAILLDVISGIDERDSTLFPGKRGNYLSYQEEPGKIRIGVPKEFMQGIDQSVEKVIWRSIHRFEELGAEYEEINLEMTKYALASYYIIAMSEASSNLARYDGLRYGFRVKDKDWTASFSSTRGKGFGEEVKRRILLGTYALSAGYYGRYYLKALRVRNLIKMEFERVFKKFDVLLTPTMPFVAFRLGEKIHDPLSLYLADVNTVSVNLAGVPAISLPCGRVDGLPVGLQIIGKHWDEERILRIAYLFEKDGYNNRS